ncbi:MAG TPA: universal stress protein [Terriglobales bacterium]|nr:universal stress protein [Terriglobales bacterium]
MHAVVIPIIPAIALKRILFATDLSENAHAAVPILSTIAHRYHSTVCMAHIQPPASFPMVSPDTLMMIEARKWKEVKERMNGLIRRPELAGLQTEVLVKSGTPAEELERMARERHIDLAVVTTHGRTGFKRFFMGSVAEYLFRHLNCPVLTIGPHIAQRFSRQKEIRNILYPTDLSPESQAIFPYLSLIAHEYRAAVKVLHVLPAEASRNPDVRLLAEPLRQEMECIMGPKLSSSCDVEFVVDMGDPVERILAHARRDNADLIGLGVRKALEISTHLPGTVAYRIAVEAECPLLTLRSSSSS